MEIETPPPRAPNGGSRPLPQGEGRSRTNSPSPCGRGSGGGVNHDVFRTRIVVTARGWIGTPYVHQASVKGAGCDCLGLLRGVWRELMGDEPESAPPYSEDWAEAQAEETMYAAFKRHFDEVDTATLIPGDIALFRMATRGPAKHCGIVAERSGVPTLIHSRANTRVTEEAFTAAWRRKLAFAFRL